MSYFVNPSRSYLRKVTWRMATCVPIISSSNGFIWAWVLSFAKYILWKSLKDLNFFTSRCFVWFVIVAQEDNFEGDERCNGCAVLDGPCAFWSLPHPALRPSRQKLGGAGQLRGPLYMERVHSVGFVSDEWQTAFETLRNALRLHLGIALPLQQYNTYRAVRTKFATCST